MLEAIKAALDPTPRQARLLESHAGAARFAYNAGLARVKDALERRERPEWSYCSLRGWWNASKDAIAVNVETGGPWWRENGKEAYDTGLESLADALSNWSGSRKGMRKGRGVGFPRFRSKVASAPGFAYATGSFGVIMDDPYGLRLPRIGRVHCMEDMPKRVGGAKVLRMTVSRRAGRWYAGLTVERADRPAPKPPRGGNVGVDLGVKELAALSDGTVMHNPHALKSNLERLKTAQRSLGRKAKGSNRRREARGRVARLRARVASRRSDMLNKLTDMLSRAYSGISVEDLNVAGMVGNHRLARAVEDASFAELRRRLAYKTARTGARLHVIDRYYPSSRACSACGTVKAKLSLSERVYHCEKCGLAIDRDLNAAININVAGSAPETVNARGGDVRRADAKRQATPSPVKREPSGSERNVRLGAGLGNETMRESFVLESN